MDLNRDIDQSSDALKQAHAQFRVGLAEHITTAGLITE